MPSRLADLGSLINRLRPDDVQLCEQKLRSWMPPAAFDVHAHLYDLRQVYPQVPVVEFEGPTRIGYEVFRRTQSSWLGDRLPSGALFFAYPVAGLDVSAANQLIHDETVSQPGLRGLLLVRPSDDPAAVERQVRESRWSGFKVYHVYAPVPHAFDAAIGDFLPAWCWEIADQYGLVIMLHLVRARALADAGNQHYLREHCRRFPNARLILAHAARGFCGAHTVEGISALRGLENVWFDTSAICEPAPFEAILRTFGTTRLMYGSDFTVSELHARPLSVGDGFYWLYEHEVDWTTWQLGRLTLCGIESLLALQQACRTCGLRDGDVERLFGSTARQLLGITTDQVSPWDAGDRRPATIGQQLARGGDRGQQQYSRARKLIPGGTQLLSKRPEMFAPGVWPPYAEEAHGCEVIDSDGRRFLDFTHNGIGACLLGFNHPLVTERVIRRSLLGSMSSLNCADELQLAERLVARHPWSQQVRLARGGGEAMAIAVRIARAATRRDLIAFCGYHGWTDWYLAANLAEDKALDGHLLPGLQPLGVPRGLRGTALPFAYNQLDQLRAIVRDRGPELAAVVMEPTRATPPASGFLAGVRQLCDDCGAKLVFDEVTTGFRLRRSSGIHLQYGIDPDLAVFAKALGNGHPMAAVIGRPSAMQAAQDTFISSTYWTEGVGPAAALATLDVMADQDVPAHVARVGEQYRAGLQALADPLGLAIQFQGYPALTTMTLGSGDKDALLTLWTTRMLDHGFLAGGGFYPTLAHADHHLERFFAAAEEVFHELATAVQRGDVLARIGGRIKQSGFRRLTN